MGKIPCRLCGSCGRYSGLSVRVCRCGADLTGAAGRLVDEPVPPEQWDGIDLSLPVFVQKCSYCGAENFTADPAQPVSTCYNCGKRRVKQVRPIPYEMEKGPPDSRDEQPPRTAPSPAPGAEPASAEEDHGDEDGGAARWRSILEGVRSSAAVPPAPDSGGEEDGEDGEDGSWSSLLDGIPPATPPAPEPVPAAVRPSVKSQLTLTALRYGPLSVTLSAGQRGLPFLLGRSAGCGEFLSRDLRVSNEHCYLTFQDGCWVVIDNHSANGTAVNREFLEFNGQRVLRDGDELTLGHHPDSMAFRVSIR